MSSPIAVAAVVHPDEGEFESLLYDFARDLTDGGAVVRGVVQRNTPNRTGGKRHMDLVEVETGTTFRISQDLGRGSTSCCLDANQMTAASQVLRRAVVEQPDLILVNRYGEQEKNGGGFADEIGQIASAGIPLVTLVAERHKPAWQAFTGHAGALLPPDPAALKRWFQGVHHQRHDQGHAGGGALARPSARPSVLDDTVALIADLLHDELAAITVERAVVGQYFTAVKLGNGSAGACYTPPKQPITSRSLDALPRGITLAGHLRNRPAADFLADIRCDQGPCRALGLAVLNALADTCWQRHPHPAWRLETGVEGLSAIETAPDDHVVLVGAFVSHIQRLKQAGQRWTVLELDPAPLTEDELPCYRPAAMAPQVVPTADVLMVTGSTLTNDTIDDLLALAPAEARVAVVGPTVGLLPDVLGARGADLLATIRITDPDHFLDVVAEGGGAQGTYDGSAERVVLRRRD